MGATIYDTADYIVQEYKIPRSQGKDRGIARHVLLALGGVMLSGVFLHIHTLEAVSRGTHVWNCVVLTIMFLAR